MDLAETGVDRGGELARNHDAQRRIRKNGLRRQWSTDLSRQIPTLEKIGDGNRRRRVTAALR